ncbi:MAG: V-type ATP synthase subunit E family protein [Porphyromonadaceae bacterium]|nr:V-type ATP synthase subunit E family protein [Porphyromonadaceae bacterium]
MSIEKITDKIINDAAAEADAVKKAAEDKALEIIEKAKADGEKLVADAKKKGALEEEQMAQRRKSVADIDSRKLILKEKQDIIDECFDNAKKAVIEDREGYIEFLTEIVRGSGAKSGEIILNERDRREIAEDLAVALKEKLSECDFTISEETKKIEGGLLIKSGKVYVNGSLEGYAEEAREELSAEIAAELFK